MMMKAIALIPARKGATRFPGKLMQNIAGVPVIARTYLSTKATGLFQDVVVVTDDFEIKNVIEALGGKVMMSTQEYESGTDRIAAAARDLVADVFVNVQGDEPFVQPEPLRLLLQEFEKDAQVTVASLVQPLTDPQWIHDENYVKVALDLKNNALFFSWCTIPFHRDKN